MNLLRRFKRIAALLSCLAFFGACGGQWVVLQAVAWAQMWVKYSRTQTIAHAAVQTFDGKHPCRLCKRISREKSEEKTPDWSVIFQKFSIARPHQTSQTEALAPGNWNQLKYCLATLMPLSKDRLAPPTPPPQIKVAS